MTESRYQLELISKLQRMFPNCFIFKNDPEELQGVPDLLILFNHHWAMLEVKLSKGSPMQANQDYYVDLFNQMSFAAFIYPENEEQVLYDLQTAFGTSW